MNAENYQFLQGITHISLVKELFDVIFVVNSVCFSPYVLDKQHTDDEKDSESRRGVSLNEKETKYKGM